MRAWRRTRNARRAARALACAAALVLVPALPASAQQLLPPDFFSRIPAEVSGKLALEADVMVFDSRSDAVIAEGNVGINFAGFRVTADRAIYYQTSGKVELVGNVAFIDPEGDTYIAERVELEDGFKRGFLEALTVAQPDGTWMTAAETSFDQGVERIYLDGTYAPCGSCIDEKGNTIGWKVKAVRVITDEEERLVHFEQPWLELLGIPVLYLPWITVPMDEDIEFPVFSFDENYGVGVHLPLFSRKISGGSLLLMPSLYSRQGFMLGAQWRQKVGDLDYTVLGSGIYQLDPAAYNGLANREWRGHIQTTGKFTPTEDWTAGWSYTAFTDPGYLPDYRIATGTVRNEVYATYLTGQSYADMRIQHFIPVGSAPSNWTEIGHQNAMERQALTHPNALAEHIHDLGENGQVEFSSRLLGLTRLQDYSSRGFTHAHAGQSAHLMVEAGWSNTYIVPGGFELSPYLGVRADAASYDGTSTPDAGSVFSATPIAALDARYPLLVRTERASTVIAPVAQLVYRGGPSLPGITNDDSHNVALSTGNIFSFNRFSGADRQETGLRANIGAMFDTSFETGSWVSGSIGQSFHLAGDNSYVATDGSTAGIGTSLDGAASYIVASLDAGIGTLLSGGGQIQFDPETGTIPAMNMRATLNHDGFSISGTFAWADVNPALGITRERQDIGVNVAVPFADYWKAKFGTSLDLVTNRLITTTAALEYDDKYLAFGVGTQFKGPVMNWSEDFRIAVSLRLRAATNRDVVNLGYAFE